MRKGRRDSDSHNMPLWGTRLPKANNNKHETRPD